MIALIRMLKMEFVKNKSLSGFCKIKVKEVHFKVRKIMYRFRDVSYGKKVGSSKTQ